VGVQERRLERDFLGQQLVEQAREAAELAPALVRDALGAQHQRQGLCRLGGQRLPQLVDAAAEKRLPAEDNVILRQAAEGIKPLLKLAESGVGRRPHRCAHAGITSVIAIREFAGRALGVRPLAAHRVVAIRKR
jgi:hypothetical protein